MMIHNFHNRCVLWISVLYLWSDQSGFMALFFVFNLWSGPAFIFEFIYFKINCSVAIFLLLPLD